MKIFRVFKKKNQFFSQEKMINKVEKKFKKFKIPIIRQFFLNY